MKPKTIIPPCLTCPYKMGLIKTFVSPCPSCKASGYLKFEHLKKQWEKLTRNDEDKE